MGEHQPHVVVRLGFAALLAVLAACGAIDPEQMEAEKLDGMELTAEQRIIANALIAGQKAESGLPVLRSRDYAEAGCYAKKVEVPRRLARAHEAYLRGYVEADEDFYPWFRTKGVNEQDAYAISQAVNKAFEECSFGTLLKARVRG